MKENEGSTPAREAEHLRGRRGLRPGYLALGVLLLAAAAALIFVTAGVASALIQVTGQAAMLTSAISTFLAVAAAFCLRAALGGRQESP